MTEEKKTIKKETKKEYLYATGRRKAAVARVRLYQTIKSGMVWGETPIIKGELFVNEKPIAEYFPSETARRLYTEPLRITNAHQKNFTFTIKVAGGGLSGQLQAVITGIASVLTVLDRDQFRAILKKKGFLSRDARVRQRRKVGTGGKARRKKQSPKR